MFNKRGREPFLLKIYFLINKIIFLKKDLHMIFSAQSII